MIQCWKEQGSVGVIAGVAGRTVRLRETEPGQQTETHLLQVNINIQTSNCVRPLRDQGAMAWLHFVVYYIY